MSFASKVDLHTHSILSQDGGINENDYAKALAEKKLDVIAITDHNTIDYATYCHKKLGDAIIIGEEIQTLQGDIIGLFLTYAMPKSLSLLETIKEIKRQNGIVYVPHPFDSKRNSIGRALKEITDEIDIIEIYNARMIFWDANKKAALFAKTNNLLTACASDAHNPSGLGHTYMILHQQIKKDTLRQSLPHADFVCKHLPLSAYLAPTYNRIKHYVFT